MVFEFLTPIEDPVFALLDQLPSQSIGANLAIHSQAAFPNLESASIALIGVLDNRGLDQERVSLAAVREAFYALFPGNWTTNLCDLGNICAGDTQEDTYFLVSKVVAELLKRNIVPIVLGGSQDLTYAVYRGYDHCDQMVNLVSIDAKFDFGSANVNLTADSYLSKMIVNEPNNLFNYCNLGFQTYYNSQEELDLLDKLFFDAYRLGEVSSNLSLAEPVLRDADLVSLDFTAIKSSASGNFSTFVPNGFDGKEICALARYAGLSEKVSTFGIFNHSSQLQEAPLVAQVIWYFIEGFNFRTQENPHSTKKGYVRYIVPIDDLELVFFKSTVTDRWWIEVPQLLNVDNNLKRNALLPCSYQDYLAACDQEIPERWWKAQRKTIL